MNEELTQKLFSAFPLLYAAKDIPASEALMIEGFRCRDGWFDLIWNLSSKLEPLIAAIPDPPEGEKKPMAFQVKEKFGTLAFYMSTYTPEIRECINNAEELSAHTCEFCGSEGVIRNMRWVRCLCFTCYNDLIVEQRDEKREDHAKRLADQAKRALSGQK